MIPFVTRASFTGELGIPGVREAVPDDFPATLVLREHPRAAFSALSGFIVVVLAVFDSLNAREVVEPEAWPTFQACEDILRIVH